MDDCFRTVFDVGRQYPPLWIPAVVVAFLLMMLWWRSNFPRVSWFWRRARRGSRVARISRRAEDAFIVLAAIGAVWAAYTVLAESRALRTGERQHVAGIVEDFEVEHPPKGADIEHFRVDGVEFEISEDDETSAFNDTRAKGGPIKPGRRVQIDFVRHRGQNAIVLLRVRCVNSVG